jgi:hypothetical protein
MPLFHTRLLKTVERMIRSFLFDDFGDIIEQNDFLPIKVAESNASTAFSVSMLKNM